jgi:hypothetical protein
MNTLFHVMTEDWQFVATVRFEVEPKEMLGHEPEVGKPVWLGPPFHPEETEYVIVSVDEEYEEKGRACVLRLKPNCTLN